MNEARRWIVIAIAVLGIVLLVGLARNGPGVGGRQPDPPVVIINNTPTTSPSSPGEPTPTTAAAGRPSDDSRPSEPAPTTAG